MISYFLPLFFTDRSITDTVVHPLRRLFHHVDHVGGVSSRTGAGNNLLFIFSHLILLNIHKVGVKEHFVGF